MLKLFLGALSLVLGAQPRVLDGDFADPFVLPVPEGYVAFATGTQSTNVQVARSSDLQHWSRAGEALPRLPAWASTEPGYTWAPAVLARGDRFVLYYTTREARSGLQCISRASSSAPEGPYVDTSEAPLVCQTKLCGSIDPSPFLDRDGKPWLVWKSDENSAACGGASRIWSRPLTEDGLAFSGEESTLLQADRGWEAPLIEGPSMVRAGDRFVLFYSASWYESARYAIGYATCEGPRGPCAKVTTDAPLLSTRGEVLGPGGQELFEDKDGQPWLVFHAWTKQTTYASGGARALHLARVTLP